MNMAFEYRRVSLNTTLMNARIFDEDSWESETDFLAKIKKEPVDNENDNSNNSWIDDNAVSIPIKEEPCFDDTTTSPIKQERIDFETKLKFETDESTNDNSCDGRVTSGKETRVSLKRRIVPYVKREPKTESPPSTPKKRLSSTSSMNSSPERKKFKDDRKRRRGREIERDPVILRRRQKQIDYGKNTIGYDRYIQSVPKHKRARTDPQTPDKYRKYSRRGFDGLIKQWRLKLHKYDPDSKDTNDPTTLDMHL